MENESTEILRKGRPDHGFRESKLWVAESGVNGRLATIDRGILVPGTRRSNDLASAYFHL